VPCWVELRVIYEVRSEEKEERALKTSSCDALSACSLCPNHKHREIALVPDLKASKLRTRPPRFKFGDHIIDRSCADSGRSSPSALLNRASMTLNATMPMMPTADMKMSRAELLK